MPGGGHDRSWLLRLACRPCVISGVTACDTPRRAVQIPNLNAPSKAILTRRHDLEREEVVPSDSQLELTELDMEHTYASAANGPILEPAFARLGARDAAHWQCQQNAHAHAHPKRSARERKLAIAKQERDGLGHRASCAIAHLSTPPRWEDTSKLSMQKRCDDSLPPPLNCTPVLGSKPPPRPSRTTRVPIIWVLRALYALHSTVGR